MPICDTDASKEMTPTYIYISYYITTLFVRFLETENTKYYVQHLSCHGLNISHHCLLPQHTCNCLLHIQCFSQERCGRCCFVLLSCVLTTALPVLLLSFIRNFIGIRVIIEESPRQWSDRGGFAWKQLVASHDKVHLLEFNGEAQGYDKWISVQPAKYT